MFKKIGIAAALAISVVYIITIISCGTGSSSNGNANTNTNTNTNTNINTNPNVNQSLGLSKFKGSHVVESAIEGICRVYADKIVLHCSENEGELTEWHLAAFDDRDLFILTCQEDELFEDMDEDGLRALEEDVNAASNCAEVMNLF